MIAGGQAAPVDCEVENCRAAGEKEFGGPTSSPGWLPLGFVYKGGILTLILFKSVILGHP